MGHPLSLTGVPAEQKRLLSYPLVVPGASAGAEPEITGLLTARGLEIRPEVSVDTVQTMVAMVRAGIGVGVVNAVALGPIDTTGVVTVDLEGADLNREVAVYWYDELLTTDVGRALHRSVLEAPLPTGALPAAGEGN